MIQCVTFNKFSLFAPRLKATPKKWKNKYPCGTKIYILNVLEMRNIKFNSTIGLGFNGIEFKFN
jgi:hypothetical protein